MRPSQLLLLMALTVLTRSMSCEWTDEKPTLINGDSGIYQFKNLRTANGTLWAGFPVGSTGTLQLTFCQPTLGYRLTCSPTAPPQFFADDYTSVVLIHVPPSGSAAGWELCSLVISSAPLCSVTLALAPCAPSMLGTTTSVTTAGSLTVSPAPSGTRSGKKLMFLDRIPMWVWISGASLIGLVILYFAFVCCVYGRQMRFDGEGSSLRGRYTPLEDQAIPVQPHSINDSLSTTRLLSPFRAFLSLRCGSLFCLVLSTRNEEPQPTLQHANNTLYSSL